MIVCKFGGTSVSDIECAEKIKEIINQNEKRKIVVVSALGKSKNYEYKITDKLIKLYENLKNNENYEEIIEKIFFRYDELSKKLNIKINWVRHKEELKKYLKNKKINREYVISRGEYYSAILYSKYLKINFLDAKNYIIFNKNGKINKKLTKNRLNSLKNNKKYIIGGFYGADKHGNIKLFDRGGSDITGAIICKLLNCEIYENYTDVNGVFDKNPNIFFGAKQLPMLDYETAIRLASQGNEVVHKTALLEMKSSNAILNVKSTNEYKKAGTILVDAKIMGSELFVCNEKYIIAVYKNNEINYCKILKLADVHIAIYVNSKLFIIIRNLKTTKEKFKRSTCCEKIFDGGIITAISQKLIDNNKLKIIKKIEEKLKKIKINTFLLRFSNKLLIIYDKNELSSVVRVINQFTN